MVLLGMPAQHTAANAPHDAAAYLSLEIKPSSRAQDQRSLGTPLRIGASLLTTTAAYNETVPNDSRGLGCGARAGLAAMALRDRPASTSTGRELSASRRVWISSPINLQLAWIGHL